MNRFVSLFIVGLTLSACSHDPAGIRITKQEAAPAMVQAQPRSEPVFYNGKTYQINFTPAPAGGYAMAVGGMSAAQQKDAVAVATSSLRQFACKSNQIGKLLSQAQYSGGQWQMTAHCA
jgi:hypothetical protein